MSSGAMSSRAVPDMRVDLINRMLDAEAIQEGYVCGPMAPLLRQFISGTNVGDFGEMIRFANTEKHKSIDWRNCTIHKERLAKADLSDPDAVFDALFKEGEEWVKKRRNIDYGMDGMDDASGFNDQARFRQRRAEGNALSRQSPMLTIGLPTTSSGPSQSRTAATASAPQGVARETRDPRMTFPHDFDGRRAGLINSTRTSLPNTPDVESRPSSSQTSVRSQPTWLTAQQSMLQPPLHNRPLPQPQPQRQSMSQPPLQSMPHSLPQGMPQSLQRTMAQPLPSNTPLPPIQSMAQSTVPERPQPPIHSSVPHTLQNLPQPSQENTRQPSSDSMLHSRSSDQSSSNVNMRGGYEAPSTVDGVAEYGQNQQQDSFDVLNDGHIPQAAPHSNGRTWNDQHATKPAPFNPPHYQGTSMFKAPVARMISLPDGDGHSSFPQTTTKQGGHTISKCDFHSIPNVADVTRESGPRAFDPYAEFASEIQRRNAQNPPQLKFIHGQIRSLDQPRLAPSVQPTSTPSILPVSVDSVQRQERNRSDVHQELNKGRPGLQREEAERRYQRELSEWKTQQAASEKRQKEQAKRKARLIREIQAEIRDGNDVLAYRYREYIEVYPAGRHERLSGYYLKLLANALIEEDDLSEAAAAVKYAKEQWFNYWTIRDKDMVIALVKERRRIAVAGEQGVRRELASGGHLMTESDVRGIRDAIGTYSIPVENP